PAGAVTVSLDLAHPANRPAVASRQAMPADLTRSFLDVMYDTFALCSAIELLRHGVRALMGARQSPCDLGKIGVPARILSGAVCADSHTSAGNSAGEPVGTAAAHPSSSQIGKALCAEKL